jgi:hypothetical protein
MVEEDTVRKRVAWIEHSANEPVIDSIKDIFRYDHIDLCTYIEGIDMFIREFWRKNFDAFVIGASLERSAQPRKMVTQFVQQYDNHGGYAISLGLIDIIRKKRKQPIILAHHTTLDDEVQIAFMRAGADSAYCFEGIITTAVFPSYIMDRI